MDKNDRAALLGAGLVAAGIGLGIVGAALIVPAVFAWTARLVEKGADGFTAKVEGASKTVGTVAGTLHRSFTEAKRVGVAEIKRSRSHEGSVTRLLSHTSAADRESDATTRHGTARHGN